MMEDETIIEPPELNLIDIGSITDLTTQFVSFSAIAIILCALIGISISKFINFMKG